MKLVYNKYKYTYAKRRTLQWCRVAQPISLNKFKRQSIKALINTRPSSIAKTGRVSSMYRSLSMISAVPEVIPLREFSDL